jgi:hypothetical protein
MEELYVEGVATHDGPEPCVGVREGTGEASVGARAGRAIEPESAGINRPGEGDENALRRRSSEPRWPRAVRRPSARAAAKRRQGYTQAG